MRTKDEVLADMDANRKAEEAAYAACSERPRMSCVVAIRGGPDKDEMLASIKAWDAAHPDKAKLLDGMEENRAKREALKEELRLAEREERAILKSRRALEDVPRVLASLDAGPDETEAIAAIDQWHHKPGLWCCLLIGGVGCGKSTAAGHYVLMESQKEFLAGRDSFRAVWVRSVEAARLSGFGDEANARFEAWRGAALLVLDDLGTEMVTPIWQQALDDVLDYRYQHSLATVITSNLKSEDFKARYGERIADRIRQDGMVRELSAQSMRRRPAPTPPATGPRKFETPAPKAPAVHVSIEDRPSRML